MISFPIDTPALSRNRADRSEDLRDPDRAIAAWPDARLLTVDDAGTAALLPSAPRLELRPAADLGPTPPVEAVLLGRVGDQDVWAAPGPVEDGRSLREVGGLLDDTDAGLLTTAVAVLTWHRNGRFCPRCGQPSTPRPAGWARTCPNGHEEFPRTDPAVIVLVHDGGDEMVLARQPVWPAGRYSVLAGFVEAGESFEATVARELYEEVGLRVTDIGYLGSQPWPFPRSVMIGFAARAEHRAPLRPQDGEIEHARWVDRATVRGLLESSDDTWSSPPPGTEISLPGSVSIARRMIEGWARLD